MCKFCETIGSDGVHVTCFMCEGSYAYLEVFPVNDAGKTRMLCRDCRNILVPRS